ncbi:hypothetical protein Nepgr_021829 [Nepenthes gracilis]|uniref:Uncharacterized protein n=1 Tax=Nepenthes gracilis TaxID=150966 RepID=A0AAD3SZ63_NEPGR|nr:hypothetical protein Nepgr_021829 [Nepenthes gracilis]
MRKQLGAPVLAKASHGEWEAPRSPNSKREPSGPCGPKFHDFRMRHLCYYRLFCTTPSLAFCQLHITEEWLNRLLDLRLEASMGGARDSSPASTPYSKTQPIEEDGAEDGPLDDLPILCILFAIVRLDLVEEEEEELGEATHR